MYKVVYTKTFEKDISRLDAAVAKRIVVKILELSSGSRNFQPIKYSPKGLEKLFKLRVGDWRILFWLDHKEKIIILYTVEHRSKIYYNL